MYYFHIWHQVLFLEGYYVYENTLVFEGESLRLWDMKDKEMKGERLSC